MAGCITRCASLDISTYVSAWTTARNHYGPVPAGMAPADRLDLYNVDFGEYNEWLTDWNTIHGGGKVDTPALFAQWMNWRLSIGTAALGNLPQRKREHVGISCAPCPYDTQADDVRSALMLGFTPAHKTDHGIYYMRVAQRGTSWGFECTDSGCQFLLENGIPYFYA